jgi:hypothetical protein
MLLPSLIATGPRRAALLFVAGAPLAAALLFLPEQMTLMRDELAWRARAGPWDYLDRRPYGAHRRLALAELDSAQRGQGLVTRLYQSGRFNEWASGAQVTHAAWRADGREILAGGAAVARRWDATSGGLLDTLGPRTRRQADDPARYGFGLDVVAYLDHGTTPAALSSGPAALWRFASGGLQRVALGAPRLEALNARDDRAAWIRALEYGEVLDLASGRTQRLAHEEITAIALAPGGRVATASRSTIRWWRDGAPQAQVRLDTRANPIGFSAEARHALVAVGRDLELWDSADGTRRVVAHEGEVGAACATADYVATGTVDGSVHLHALPDLAHLRSFRSSQGPRRLLAVGDHGTDARVWDVAGSAQSAPVPVTAPPRLSRFVTLGADWNLPGRFPALFDALDQVRNETWSFLGVGAWGVLLVAVFWVARGRRAQAPR